MNEGLLALKRQWHSALQQRRQQQLFRELRFQPETDKGWIDLHSNDYLAIRKDKHLKTTILKKLEDVAICSSGSRLLGGEHLGLHLLEKAFLDFTGHHSTLFFPSGFAANEALIHCIYQTDALIFSDELNHASIIDGIRYGPWQKNQRRIFKHNDLFDLETQLKRSNAAINFVVTEAVFSMDGDRSPLLELMELCQKYRGVLIVDEAHSIGVDGDGGKGVAQYFISDDDLPLIIITPTGKALAGQGSFISGPSYLRDYLINFARPLIYSTAPSPLVTTALTEVIQGIVSKDNDRRRLISIVREIRNFLTSLGFVVLGEDSPIVPIVCGDSSRALLLAKSARQHKIVCPAIRPPTVPKGQSRLRLSLHAGLTDHELQRIKEFFKHEAL